MPSDLEIFKKLKRFTSVYMPGQDLNIEFAKEKGSLFERHGIEKEIERTFQKNVHLKSGGSIVIEKTESLVAIDVNTGKFTGNNKGLEETVYKNNVEAAQEIANDRAVAAGADRATLHTIESEDMPLAYLPGNSVRVRVRVVGDVAATA